MIGSIYFESCTEIEILESFFLMIVDSRHYFDFHQMIVINKLTVYSCQDVLSIINFVNTGSHKYTCNVSEVYIQQYKDNKVIGFTTEHNIWYKMADIFETLQNFMLQLLQNIRYLKKVSTCVKNRCEVFGIII